VKYLALFIFLLCSFYSPPKAMRAYHLQGQAQGTSWHIVYYAADSLFTQAAADSLFNQVDSSLSLYKPYSLVNAFNRSARGLAGDKHLRQVVSKALEVHARSEKAFDITVWPLVNAWGFGHQKITALPDSNDVRKLMPCTGSQYLQLTKDSIIKLKPCLQLDVNGIAQGYTVDMLAQNLESNSIINYLVEVGGEMRIRGHKQPEGQLFRIGIESPSNSPFETAPIQKILALPGGALTTSGNYRRYYESDGKRIAHVLDPRTGFPVNNSLLSVTVLAPDAMTADAYDNAFMVLGPQQSMELIKRTPGLEAYFIYRTPGGQLADTATAGFYKLMQN
jgi:FAD:protein FMN transferase